MSEPWTPSLLNFKEPHTLSFSLYFEGVQLFSLSVFGGWRWIYLQRSILLLICGGGFLCSVQTFPWFIVWGIYFHYANIFLTFVYSVLFIYLSTYLYFEGWRISLHFPDFCRKDLFKVFQHFPGLCLGVYSDRLIFTTILFSSHFFFSLSRPLPGSPRVLELSAHSYDYFLCEPKVPHPFFLCIIIFFSLFISSCPSLFILSLDS